MSGRAVHFGGSDGYGFIQPDDGSPDVFLHHSEIGAWLRLMITGKRVSFDTTVDGRGTGLKAQNLQLIDD